MTARHTIPLLLILLSTTPRVSSAASLSDERKFALNSRICAGSALGRAAATPRLAKRAGKVIMAVVGGGRGRVLRGQCRQRSGSWQCAYRFPPS